MIPPEKDAEFVKSMEEVLDLYQKPLDTEIPVVNMDEQSVTLRDDVRDPHPVKPGQVKRLEIVHTPIHGSWLNIAEIELSVLTRQCLCRRIPDIETLHRETQAWKKRRNAEQKQVNWQWTTDDARVRLKHLNPNN